MNYNICTSKKCIALTEEVQYNTTKGVIKCSQCGEPMTKLKFKNTDDAIVWMVSFYKKNAITRFAGYLTRPTHIRFW